MPPQVRHRSLWWGLITFCILVNVLAPGRTAAQPLSFVDGCVEPMPNGIYRTLTSPSGSRVWLAHAGGRARLCVVMTRCAWRISELQRGNLGRFANLVGELSECRAADDYGRWMRGGYYESHCPMPDRLYQALAPMQVWLEQIMPTTFRCGTVTAPLVGQVVGASSTLVLASTAARCVPSFDGRPQNADRMGCSTRRRLPCREDRPRGHFVEIGSVVGGDIALVDRIG
jgi:hypothetical protein